MEGAQIDATETSSSHASVLDAIEHAVSMYSTQRQRDGAKKKWSAASDVAVINEMLSNRNQNVLKKKKKEHRDDNKGFKTGTFKFKKLHNLETV